MLQHGACTATMNRCTPTFKKKGKTMPPPNVSRRPAGVFLSTIIGLAMTHGNFTNSAFAQEHFGNDPAGTAVRTIQFAGYNWIVKSGFGGPGPNNWSDSGQSVWVDSLGRLHLKIRKINGAWHCAEVYTEHFTDYGEHRFFTEGPIDRMDKNVVLGLFVYADDRNEIDIEYTKWGQANNRHTGHYTVQPYTTSGNGWDFPVRLDSLRSTHFFNWQRDSISFGTIQGHYLAEPDSAKRYVQRWTYKGHDIPNPLRRLKTRINLWLFHGAAPVDTSNLEVIVTQVIQPRPLGTSVESRGEAVPEGFILHQNYPNPFNPRTTITFSLPAPAWLSLRIYDLLGREVASLLSNRRYEAGTHAIFFNALDLPPASGIYFYTLTAKAAAEGRVIFAQTRPMLLVK